MSRLSSSLYRSYGAYELKAAYQRNLLIGMLITLALVLLLVGVGWALGGGEATTVTVPVGRAIEPIEVRVDIRPISIHDDFSTGGPSRSAERPEGGIIPRPVADDELDIDAEGQLLSTADRASLVDGFGEPGTGEEGAGGYAEGNVADYFRPPIDSFYIVEHYPELIHSVKPVYPRFAELSDLEGRVIIKALVGPKGSVLDAVVYGSSGHLLLDEAALAVAGKYKYKPAIQNGSPIAVWVTYKVEFKLE